MDKVIWKEFPEINRKVAFLVTYQSLEGVGSLGCHTGSISYLKVSYGGEGYYYKNALQDKYGEWIKLLYPLNPDGTAAEPVKWKDANFDYASTSYRPYREIDPLEAKLIKDYIKSKNITAQDFGKELFDLIIQACESRPLWVLSDVINYKSTARNGGHREGVPLSAHAQAIQEEGQHLPNTTIALTVDFVNYLIKNKIGIVVPSPIIQNPNHRRWGLYSLNQGWFWIPEKHVSRAIDSTNGQGMEKLPSRKAWLEQVASDFQEGHRADGGAVFSRETMLSDLFNESQFPDHARFAKEE